MNGYVLLSTIREDNKYTSGTNNYFKHRKAMHVNRMRYKCRTKSLHKLDLN